MAPPASKRIQACYPSAFKWSTWSSDFAGSGTNRERATSTRNRANQYTVVSKQPKGTSSRFWSSFTVLFCEKMILTFYECTRLMSVQQVAIEREQESSIPQLTARTFLVPHPTASKFGIRVCLILAFIFGCFYDEPFSTSTPSLDTAPSLDGPFALAMASTRTTSYVSDEVLLASLGYKQELKREFKHFEVGWTRILVHVAASQTMVLVSVGVRSRVGLLWTSTIDSVRSDGFSYPCLSSLDVELLVHLAGSCFHFRYRMEGLCRWCGAYVDTSPSHSLFFDPF